MSIRPIRIEELLVLADLAVEGRVILRDAGLLASAAERPFTILFGQEQYPTLLDKAATLLHSIARFHPLIDGNKRLAWIAAAALIERNGAEVIATNDQAYDLTIAVAAGELAEVSDIAKALEPLVSIPAP